MYYIGTDLGTSAVKLLLMDENGEIVSIVSESYPLSHPHDGWSEQNPYDWFDKTILGIKKLTEGIDKNLVAGISFGGQMHGLVILDENDNVIRPAILWNDGRTEEENAFLNQNKDLLVKNTSNICFAGFTAPKLLWLKKHEPENFAKISKIMLPKDYIAYRLTGVFSTDVSDASGTLLFDVKNKCWSDEMLKICSITKNQLPNIYESSQATGTLLPDIAEELGLSSNVIAAAGAGDNAAAAVGTGVTGKGGCNISLGTSGTIFVSGDYFENHQNNAIHHFAHADGGYHLMGCILSAAYCTKWWLEDIIGTNDYSGEYSTIANLGKNNVFFLPYLVGERSPHNDTKIRGAFLGLSADTSRSDMTQAVLEGVAFAIRDCFEAIRLDGIEIQSTKICGGGAKSALWKEIIANVLNICVDCVETEEGPSYGAAMLAAVACGQFESADKASKQIVKISGSVYPNAETAKLYNEKYREYIKIYPTLKDLFR